MEPSCGCDVPGWIDGIKIPFQNLMGRIWTAVGSWWRTESLGWASVDTVVGLSVSIGSMGLEHASVGPPMFKHFEVQYLLFSLIRLVKVQSPPRIMLLRKYVPPFDLESLKDETVLFSLHFCLKNDWPGGSSSRIYPAEICGKKVVWAPRSARNCQRPCDLKMFGSWTGKSEGSRSKVGKR